MRGLVLSGLLMVTGVCLVSPVYAQGYLCEDQVRLSEEEMSCFQYGPEVPPMPPADPATTNLRSRLSRYTDLAMRHKLDGLASYYSHSLDGSLTANGEHYHELRYSAAHLTLPLGSWVEVTSKATGRKIRLRVNDRGPYAQKFILDLSYAAAHALGVDVAADRTVEIRLLALPGEEPLPEEGADKIVGPPMSGAGVQGVASAVR